MNLEKRWFLDGGEGWGFILSLRLICIMLSFWLSDDILIIYLKVIRCYFRYLFFKKEEKFVEEKCYCVLFVKVVGVG